MKFEVKESEWLRGKANSALSKFTEDNLIKRCCLGFLGLACGLSDSDMNQKITPAECITNWGLKLVFDNKNTKLCSDIMIVNDAAIGHIPLRSIGPPMTNELRKQTLTNLFMQAGHEITFVP